MRYDSIDCLPWLVCCTSPPKICPTVREHAWILLDIVRCAFDLPTYLLAAVGLAAQNSSCSEREQSKVSCSLWYVVVALNSIRHW